MIREAVDTLYIAAGLIAWGSHAAVPPSLARAEAPARLAWARRRAPLLLLAGVLGLTWLFAAHPDPAIAAGLAPLPAGGPWALPLTLALVATAVGDLLLAAAGEKLEPAGWRLTGLLGVAGLVAVAGAGELLTAGAFAAAPAVGPPVPAILLRAVVALAAADLFLPGRPRWSLAAAPAAALYPLALDPALARELWIYGDLFTLWAGALVLAGARWVPAGPGGRPAKAAVAAGLILVSLALARTLQVAGELAARLGLP